MLVILLYLGLCFESPYQPLEYTLKSLGIFLKLAIIRT
jgi:hypothetical protein